MKKIILSLITLFSMVISAETLTQKQEMLKQFVVFQKALETKNGNTLKGMIKFPITIIEYGRDYEEAMKESDFLEELDAITEHLKSFSYMKVDIANSTISGYFEKGHACSLNYTGDFRGNELIITANWVSEESNACDGHTAYKFKMYNNKLKLFDVETKL